MAKIRKATLELAIRDLQTQVRTVATRHEHDMKALEARLQRADKDRADIAGRLGQLDRTLIELQAAIRDGAETIKLAMSKRMAEIERRASLDHVRVEELREIASQLKHDDATIAWSKNRINELSEQMGSWSARLAALHSVISRQKTKAKAQPPAQLPLADMPDDDTP